MISMLQSLRTAEVIFMHFNNRSSKSSIGNVWGNALERKIIHAVTGVTPRLITVTGPGASMARGGRRVGR